MVVALHLSNPAPNTAIVLHPSNHPPSDPEELRSAIAALSAPTNQKQASNAAYARLLQACGDLQCPEAGKHLHEFLVSRKMDLDTYIGNYVVQMYIKCLWIDDAREHFDRLRHRNAISWNTMVAAYAHLGQLDEALGLIAQMPGDYVKPSAITFFGLLGECGSIEDGSRAHQCAIDHGLEADPLVAPAIASMYARLGAAWRGEEIVASGTAAREWGVVAWNVVITAFAHHAPSAAIWSFRRMELYGVAPDAITIVGALGSCSRAEEGVAIHARAVALGFLCNEIVGNAIVTMYSRLDRLDIARDAFEQRDPARLSVVAWNTMITAYGQHGRFLEAVRTFQAMLLEGVEPDNVTFAAVLSSCSKSSSEDLGERRQSMLVACSCESRWCEDVIVATALVSALGRIPRRMEEARAVFDGMPRRNVVTWNAMIAAYAQFGRWAEAAMLFRRCQLEGIELSHGSFVSILSSSSEDHRDLRPLADIRFVHWCAIQSGFEADEVFASALLAMYGTWGSIDEARALFNRIPARSVVSWTTMIQILAQDESTHGEARELFHRMLLDNGARPNRVTLTAVLCAVHDVDHVVNELSIVGQCGLESDPLVAAAVVGLYARCRRLHDAMTAFYRAIIRSPALYATVIAAAACLGSLTDTARLFRDMLQEGVPPAVPALVAVLEHCASCSGGEGLALGKQVHAVAAYRGGGLADPAICSAVCNMYGKCGELKMAVELFEQMPAAARDGVAWNALLAGFAQHGDADRAAAALEAMLLEGIAVDGVTFVAVLAACAHDASDSTIDRGGGFFRAMVGDHGVAPSAKHYGCVVDLLARRGLLASAEELVAVMPFQPGESEWMALLGGCRTHQDVSRGQRAASRLLCTNGANRAAGVMLSNVLKSDKPL